MTETEESNEDKEIFERKKAFIDVLLKQYDFLRSEITQSIYLEHTAILALYTFLGVAVVYLVGAENSLNGIFNPDNLFLFSFTLILAQLVVNSFGSLFLWEQCRNRRACSFLRAIEYLINKEIRKIGIYWESYIISYLVTEKKEYLDLFLEKKGENNWKKEKKWKRREYIWHNLPINRQYYKNRVLGVGVPIFLPNILIPFTISYKLIDNFDPMCLLFSIISWVITFLWSCMIIRKTFTPLSKDEIPDRGKVLNWLRNEEQKLKDELKQEDNKKAKKTMG